MATWNSLNPGFSRITARTSTRPGSVFRPHVLVAHDLAAGEVEASDHSATGVAVVAVGPDGVRDHGVILRRLEDLVDTLLDILLLAREAVVARLLFHELLVRGSELRRNGGRCIARLDGTRSRRLTA